MAKGRKTGDRDSPLGFGVVVVRHRCRGAPRLVVLTEAVWRASRWTR